MSSFIYNMLTLMFVGTAHDVDKETTDWPEMSSKSARNTLPSLCFVFLNESPFPRITLFVNTGAFLTKRNQETPRVLSCSCTHPSVYAKPGWLAPDVPNTLLRNHAFWGRRFTSHRGRSLVFSCIVPQQQFRTISRDNIYILSSFFSSWMLIWPSCYRKEAD